jgi:hypothetical protein
MFRTIVAGSDGHANRSDAVALARTIAGAQHARHVLVTAAPGAAHAVRRAAEREQADPIVVGSNRRRGDGHASGPDRALQVLRGASCAVAVVPDGGRAPGRLESLAVGFDGSRESWSAPALAVDLARPAHAELRICLALARADLLVGDPESALTDAAEQAETAAAAP